MEDSLQYFKALADETRLRLLNILCRHELNVNELVLILDMGQSRISRHLKILTSAGLLTWRREGLWVFYTIAQEGKPRDFINAVRPFMSNGGIFKADLDLATGMIEERVLKTRNFFNTIAEDWDKLSREVMGDFELAQYISRHMPRCAVAVDLGCGTGNVLHAMLQKAETVIGVDGSARMLELARRRFVYEGERVSLRIGDLSHLPLADGEADFAALNMVLHHVPEPEVVLHEIKRVLAPGGQLLLTDFDHHEDEGMRSEYGDLWLGFSKEKLDAHITQSGFQLVQSDYVKVRRNLALHVVMAKNVC